MVISITKFDAQRDNEDGADVTTNYLVTENAIEFSITCKSNHCGRSFSLVGKEGTLYIDREDNKVHLQKVALGGGCGLIIDDEPVEGLSPMAIRAIILAEQGEGSKEITITTGQTGDGNHYPLLTIDGIRKDIHQFSDIFTDLEELK